MCADLGTAVGKDITTSALKLVEVAGPGEDVETLGVSWPEISQTNCMAILKAGPATSEDATEDGVVVVESRQVNLPRPRPRCVRNKEGILQAAAPTRVFTSLNLASFALVSLGVTGETFVLISGQARPDQPYQPLSLSRQEPSLQPRPLRLCRT